MGSLGSLGRWVVGSLGRWVVGVVGVGLGFRFPAVWVGVVGVGGVGLGFRFPAGVLPCLEFKTKFDPFQP